MNKEERKQIAFRMITRVETGLMFIRDKFVYEPRRTNAGGPDAAWIRNAYILFSFYFELLLKTELVLTKSFADIIELDTKLRKLGHHIGDMCHAIDNLEDIGIKDFSFENGEYKISTFDKTIYIKDFVDIRYDFVEGKIRNLPMNENSIIEESLDGADEIVKKIKYKHFAS